MPGTKDLHHGRCTGDTPAAPAFHAVAKAVHLAFGGSHTAQTVYAYATGLQALTVIHNGLRHGSQVLQESLGLLTLLTVEDLQRFSKRRNEGRTGRIVCIQCCEQSITDLVLLRK